MYRYLSRASFRSLMDSRKIGNGHEFVQKDDLMRVLTSQACPDIWDTCMFRRIKSLGARDLQIQIINALRLGQRSRAHEILADLSCMNGSSNAKDFDFILEYCAQAPDPLFAMEAWKIMRKNDLSMKKSYRCIIQAFSNGGYFKEAFEWIASLNESDYFHTDLPLCNLVLRECADKKSYIDVDRCLELMDNQLLGRSEITYWELLKYFVRQKSMPAVNGIWKDCIQHYTPSIIMLRKFIWSFTRLNDLESAYKVLQYMVSLISSDISLRKSAGGKYTSSRIDIPIPLACQLSECFKSKENMFFQSMLNNFKLAKEEMIEGKMICSQNKTFDYCIPKETQFLPVSNVLRWSFNDVIHNCAQFGSWELAEFLFLQMQAIGVEPSRHTYDGLIKSVTHGRALTFGLELIDSMERRGMKPYNETLAMLSAEHSKNLDLYRAESLLEMISDNHPKFIHPFNTYLVACDIMDEPERAVHILAKIKCLNIRPNIRTFEILFSLFGNVNAPYERGNWPSHMHTAERIRHIEMGMMRSRVQHSYTSMKNMIRALGMEGMISEMLLRLEEAERTLLEMEPHQITDLYNIILRALIEAGQSAIAIEYFQRMRSFGFIADAATYHIMIECCSLIPSFQSAFALLSLMIRDGFIPHIMTYTALVKVLLAAGDFQGALYILNQAISDEIQVDVLIFNEILQQAFTKISSKEENYTKVDEIEIVIEQMRRNNVKPDPSTCTFAFCAYSELDLHSTAVEALRVLSLRMISENDDLQEKKMRYADLLCDEDPEVESKIISIFEGGEEYLAIGLLNLRWCTFMMGHPFSWFPEESLWAQRLSSS